MFRKRRLVIGGVIVLNLMTNFLDAGQLCCVAQEIYLGSNRLQVFLVQLEFEVVSKSLVR